MSREMFAVKINQTQLEYDVNSIVKAFYPGEMIQVLTPDVSEEKRREWEDKIRMDICLDENSARISVTDGEERKEYNWKNNPQGGICKNEFKKFFYQFSIIIFISSIILRHFYCFMISYSNCHSTIKMFC